MEDLGIGFSLVRTLLRLLHLRMQGVWDMETQATQIVTEHVESMKRLNWCLPSPWSFNML